MPVKIPKTLPARAVLEGENIFVMGEDVAGRQDIRPLRVAILNLMPTKVSTETQLLRLLGNTPLQVEVDLLRTATYEPLNTDPGHLSAHYRDFDSIKDRKVDGLIITGAPVEQMEFEKVHYWRELCGIMDWARENVASTLHLCWGAQAGLYHHFGVPKHPLPEKMFGVFEHRVLASADPLFRGFDDTFMAPHSRHTETRRADVLAVSKSHELVLLADSEEAGVHMLATRDGRQVFVTGHPEYDSLTLKAEYDRDVSRGLPVAPPRHYFPADDPARAPRVNWRGHAHLLFSNWLNYCVYQVASFGKT